MISNCRNITYNPRNVTLTWVPPLRELQNGKITGYLLMCYEEGPSNHVPGTNGTMDSISTIYIIPIITPFRSYTCSLSAINTVGIGPEGFCTFRSGEDSQCIYIIFIVLKYQSLSLLYEFMTKQGKNPYAITSYHTYWNFIVCNNILHLQS